MNKDRLVLITGASSGIGWALAEEFHSSGYNLLLVARREDRLKDLANKLNEIRTDSVTFRICDLSDRQQSRSLATEISGNNLYGLINNAGRGSLGSFDSLDLDSELSQIELNVNAHLILMHAALPAMIKRKDGFIINVSSIMAYQAVPYVATYAASKSFERQHSLAVARELEDRGVRLMTLCPGPTETEFFGVAKVPGKLSSFKRAAPSSVAKSCLHALQRGDRICIPGMQARLLVLLARIMPTNLYTYGIKKYLQYKRL